MQEIIDRLQQFLPLKVEFRPPAARAAEGSKEPVLVTFDGPCAMRVREQSMEGPVGLGRTVEEAIEALWRQVDRTADGRPYPFLIRKVYGRGGQPDTYEKLRWTRDQGWVDALEPLPLS